MLFKTRGIVLTFIKYKETSIIVKIYTELFGLQSYIVNNVRTAGVKSKIALYQPLNLLDLVVYHKKTVAIHRISDLKCSEMLQSIPLDFKKSCIGMFLTEVLLKTVKEEESNPNLFNFLHTSILTLDYLDKNFENFHLKFLLGLTIYLGFYPESGESLVDEVYKNKIDNKEIIPLVNKLLESNYTADLKISNNARREILELLLKFYQYHVEGFGELKCVEVLKEMMG